MKKIFALLLTLAMLVGAVALAEAADLTGTWYLNELNLDGVALSPASMGLEMTIVLNEDGTTTATYEGEGESETGEGTWSVDGDVITITIEDDPYDFTLVDGNLVSDDEDMGMTFGREKVEGETYEPAPAKEDAALEDYAGDWTATKLGFGAMFLDPSLVFGEDSDITAAIEGSTVTLNGYLFFDETIETEFADGALVYTYPEDSIMYSGSSITIQVLEDDSLSVLLASEDEDDDDMVIIFARSEAE